MSLRNMEKMKKENGIKIPFFIFPTLRQEILLANLILGSAPKNT